MFLKRFVETPRLIMNNIHEYDISRISFICFIFNMNWGEFAKFHLQRLYQVVQMMIKGFQSSFKVVGRSIYIYIYIYIYVNMYIPSQARTRLIRED